MSQVPVIKNYLTRAETLILVKDDPQLGGERGRAGRGVENYPHGRGEAWLRGAICEACVDGLMR